MRSRGPSLQDSVNEDFAVSSFHIVFDHERELLVLMTEGGPGCRATLASP